MRTSLPRTAAVCAVSLLALMARPAADTSVQTLPFSQSWANTALISTANVWSSVPGVVGYRGDGMAGTTGVNPQTVLADGAATPVNVIANLTSTAVTTGGIAEFELQNPVVALQGSGTARAPHLVITVSTTGQSNIHVSYVLRDIDGTPDNAVQPVALQYRVGTSGNYTDVPAGFVADASSGPSLATLVIPVSVDLPAAAANHPVVQVRIITTDAVGSDEWIGIDDINVTGTPSGDTAPSVSSTYPAAGATDVAASSTIAIGFSESVTPTASAFALQCGGAAQEVSVTGSGSTVTLTPASPLPTSATCTVTVSAGGVSDVDSDDPPDNMAADYSFSFTTAGPTDAAPAVVSTTPSNGETNVAVDTAVVIRFSESVAATGAFALECPAGTPLAMTTSGSPATSFTLTPGSALPYSTTCAVKVYAAGISDNDAIDPPDHPASDVVWSFTTAAAPPASNAPVVISQIYGGGGNSGAVYRNDFIELYNRGTATMDLSGWSVQYASTSGTSWSNLQALVGTIAPGQYLLVSLASGGTTGDPLPEANILGQINMSATNGKVALVNTSDQLSGSCPIGDARVVDFVGYGTANCREGTAAAPAPSNATAVLRLGGGATDTDHNDLDFTVGVPIPRRTAPIVEAGPSVVSTDPASNSTIAPRDATMAIAFTEAVDVTDPWFDITCATSGQHSSVTTAVSRDSKVHYITPNDNFVPAEKCTVTVLKSGVADQDLDDATPDLNNLKADYVWSFTIATGTEPPYPPDVHLAMGNPSFAVADVSQPDDYLMEKPEYAMSYNRTLGRPNWVSWHLSDEWVGSLARNDTFRPDPAIPPDWYRVQSFDFSSTGFDRGHMAPNADRDKETSVPINQATFLMSNMVAQAPDNNQGPWAELENYLRSLLPANELYIVAGGWGAGGVGGSSSATMNTVADGHVTVPSHTWKVALVLPKLDGDDVLGVNCSRTSIAVVMPNVQGIRDTPWQNYLTTVDAVETMTGYDFFSNVPEPYQRCVEAGINGNNPPLVKGTQTITFDQPQDATYGDGPFTVSATGGKSGSPVTFVGSGACTAGGTYGSTITVTSAGTCTITASQAGSEIYEPAADVTRRLAVQKAAASVSVSGYAGVYDGQAHGATGTAKGANNEDLGALMTFGSTFTNVPGGTAHWSFIGSGNYQPQSGDIAIAITQATLVVSGINVPDVELGSPSLVVSGVLSLGTLIPTGLVTVTVGGASAQALVGSDGRFTATVPAASLTLAGSPYAVNVTYAGDTNFTPASGMGFARVVDTTAPVIASTAATPGVIRPPNLKMIDVAVNYSTSDISGASCSLSVASNEPINGIGDGNTSVDWQVLGVHRVLLRAERAGTGDGRIYTITVTCADPVGNRSAALTTVSVPK